MGEIPGIVANSVHCILAIETKDILFYFSLIPLKSHLSTVAVKIKMKKKNFSQCGAHGMALVVIQRTTSPDLDYYFICNCI